MKPQKCLICDKEITTGRKTHTGDLVCNSNECFAEWFLNNSNLWGYDITGDVR